MPHYKKFSRLAEKTTYIPRDQFVQVAEALKESLACYLSLMFLSEGRTIQNKNGWRLDVLR
jgi:hypothetical protein